MKPTQLRFQIATVVALAAVFLAASSASATTWNIREDLSSLSTLGTTVVGIPLDPQSPGSDTFSVDGTIEGTLSGSSLDLTGALSNVVANPLAVNTYLPLAVNRTNDNAGQMAAAIFFNSAIGNLVLTLQNGTLVNGSPANGMGAAEVGYVDGWLEFQTPIFAGGVTQSGSLAGDDDANISPALFTITYIGLTERLTIPIQIENDNGGGTVIRTTGQIIAEREIVPEPSSFLLAGLGAVGLAYVVRRRKK